MFHDHWCGAIRLGFAQGDSAIKHRLVEGARDPGVRARVRLERFKAAGLEGGEIPAHAGERHTGAFGMRDFVAFGRDQAQCVLQFAGGNWLMHQTGDQTVTEQGDGTGWVVKVEVSGHATMVRQLRAC